MSCLEQSQLNLSNFIINYTIKKTNFKCGNFNKNSVHCQQACKNHTLRNRKRGKLMALDLITQTGTLLLNCLNALVAVDSNRLDEGGRNHLKTTGWQMCQTDVEATFIFRIVP